jgi:hypothetical protein
MTAPTGEVERVAAALEDLIHDAPEPEIEGVLTESLALLRSLAKDAERYRYIRAHSICGPGTHNYDPTQWKVGDPRPETMDAHIDAAIEAAGRTEGGGG